MAQDALRTLLTCLCILVFPCLLNAQQEGDYRSIAGGAWNLPQHWEVFNNGNWQAAAASPTQQDGNIEVNHAIFISSDQVADQLSINPGAELVINPGVMLTITNSADPHDLIVKGKILNRGMIFFSPSALMNLDSASYYIHNTSNASSHVLDATQFHPKSDWIYRGNGTLNPPVSLSNRHYGNLSFESEAGSWSRTLSGSSGASCRDLRVDQNVMLINNYTGLLQISGDLLLNGQLVNGSGIQKIKMTGNPSQMGGNNLQYFFDELTIGVQAKYYLADNMKCSAGSLILAEGFLDCDDKQITGNNNTNFILNDFAWLRSAHTGGITMSVRQFTSAQFHAGACYEIGGIQNKTLSFFNPQMRNLRINAPGSVSLLSNDSVHITGVLMLDSGSFVLKSASLHLSGTAISGNEYNLLADSNSSLYFSGTDTSVYVPSSVSGLKVLGINKTGNDVFLHNDLRIFHQLCLTRGKLKTGPFTLFCEGSPESGIEGGSDSSFVSGKLGRRIPAGDSLSLAFPVGGEYYEALEIRGISCDAETDLLVEAIEHTPSGSSMHSVLSNRYWRMTVNGPNFLRSIPELKLQPHSLLPALTDSSDIVVSSSDSIHSYAGLGGMVDPLSSVISSEKAFTLCLLSNLGQGSGLFIGISENSPGVEADSLCRIQLELKVLVQGLYRGSGRMRSAISDTSQNGVCDTLLVSLHQPSYPYGLISSHKCTLDTAGRVLLKPEWIDGMECYLSIRHRNSLETWSRYPLVLNSPFTYYNFSDSASSAFGNNLADLQDGYFAIYSGDVFNSQMPNETFGDGLIDQADMNKLENSMMQFLSGYLPCDLTGDGITDNADYSLMENNVNLNVERKRP